MKKRDLEKLGIEGKGALALATSVCSRSRSFGVKKSALKKDLKDLVENPARYLSNELYQALAEAVISYNEGSDRKSYEFNEAPDYACWGDDIEPDAHQQMENACSLPISVQGALMPDAHVGYGLPIGGVLATENSVIPYAVGVDIACRVMLTVFDAPVEDLRRRRVFFEDAIEKNTQFGIGARWKNPADHDVMSADWEATPYLRSLKNNAWHQLGTSGSGNHFVEFGELELFESEDGVEAGRYLTLVSHSGSRGAGSKIAGHYSKLARDLHPDLPEKLKHLAWLDLDSEEGQEYWVAMQLMGEYASANHDVIHKRIRRHLNMTELYRVENHHNFAWKEEHCGREVIVHRKGATPAAEGERGYIPGSMIAPGFLVAGRGNAASLSSCAHGAGRQMSRKKARQSTTYHALKKELSEHGVTLLSAGLDEAPHAYKDINRVMSAQTDLVRKIARFTPRIVKMAPEEER